MKRLILLCAVCSATILSCKKDGEDVKQVVLSPPPVYPNYTQLKVGNYWIYERYAIDENGVATPTSIFDSCYISEGPQINGVQYVELVQPLFMLPEPDPYLRDSLHYLVNSKGDILFSSQDFSSVFSSTFVLGLGEDTVAHKFRKMDGNGLTVNTPAGDFFTYDAKTTYAFYPGYDAVPFRYLHARYAENVGLVLQSGPIFIGSMNSFERRLIRYHIENQ